LKSKEKIIFKMKSAIILFLISCIFLIAASGGGGPTTKSRGMGYLSTAQCEIQKGKGNCEKFGPLFYPKCSAMFSNRYSASGCCLW
jgi:hypothetical protein